MYWRAISYHFYNDIDDKGYFVDVHSFIVFAFLFFLYVAYGFVSCSPYLEDTEVSISYHFYNDINYTG